MISLHIEATDGADLRKKLADILGTSGWTAVVASAATEAPDVRSNTAEEAAAPVKRTRAKKDEVKPAAEGEPQSGQPDTPAADTSEATTAGTTASTASAGTDAVTIDDLRELTLSVVDKCGREKIEEILGQFGIARATQVADDQRDELATSLRDALATAG